MASPNDLNTAVLDGLPCPLINDEAITNATTMQYVIIQWIAARGSSERAMKWWVIVLMIMKRSNINNMNHQYHPN
jgi:hypothetical protein